MRILFVSPVGALFSGAEVSILNLMEYLSKSGHRVYNVIPDNEGNADSTYLNRMETAGIKYYSLRSLCWWWLESKDISEANRTAAILYHHKNIADIRQIIREEKIELVISNTVNVFQGAIAAALENCRHYYLIHEFPKGEFEYYKDKLPLIDLLSDKIFAVHGELHKELSEYFSQNKLESFLPYSHINRSQIIEANEYRIVSIGGISKWKNQLELIRAFDKIESENLELLFIGGWDEEYKLECDKYIRENDVKNVSFLGYKDNPWQYVTNKDLLVLPSKFESFSLVLIEAILNGIPIIASDNLGHQTVGNLFGFKDFYKIGEISSLTEKIKEYLHEYDFHKEEIRVLGDLVRNLYTIPEAYKNILVEIEKPLVPKSKKIVSGLGDLLDASLSNSTLKYVENEKVTIFYESEKDEFSVASSKIFPLETLGKIYISSNFSNKIRIDLTENPSVFKDVTLQSIRTGDILSPVFTNGVMKDNYYIFYQEDPQIIFDTSKYHNEDLLLTYKYSPISSLGDKLFNLFEETNNQLILKKQEFEKILAEKNNALQNLEQQYLEIERQFNAVLHSKRWILATRIAELFRRIK